MVGWHGLVLRGPCSFVEVLLSVGSKVYFVAAALARIVVRSRPQAGGSRPLSAVEVWKVVERV